MITKHLFGSNLVAVGHGNIVHLVAKAQYQAVLGICPSGADALPDSDVLLCFLVLPVADDRLAGLAHAAEDVCILTVAVCALVEIHEVHVHSLVWNVLVVLCVEVQKRLAQNLKSVYPHLGG